MPALNYQKRFAVLVKNRVKRSTIRATRKRPIYIGDTLYHYTGMRSKQCRLLREDKCTLVRDIQIKANGTVLIDGQAIYQKNAAAIAFQDGFVSLQEFIDFFCPAGADFRGQYIQW